MPDPTPERLMPAEWLIIGDIGRSSKTMCSAFIGRQMRDPSTPSDPSDFRRCWLFVQDVDGVKGNLQKVVEMYPFWGPFVNRWSEIEQTMVSEIGDIRSWSHGSAIKTYNLIRHIETESYRIRYPEDEYEIAYREDGTWSSVAPREV